MSRATSEMESADEQQHGLDVIMLCAFMLPPLLQAIVKT
jgi:hypothetical protein